MTSQKLNDYVCWFRTEAVAGYFVWRSGDVDSLLVDENGRIVFHAELDKLRDAGKAFGAELVAEEPISYDFMKLEHWIAAPLASTIDCSDFLDAWNLFNDLAASNVGISFPSGAKTTVKSLYEKLFWGSNLPSITPATEAFVPIWSSAELKTLATILQEGLKLFEQSIAA